MKKIISFIMAAALLLSLITPVLADNTDSKREEILASVKARVEIPEEYTEFEIQEKTQYGITAYSFDWSAKDDDNHNSLSVTCLDDGTIVEYNNNEGERYYNDKPSISELSAEDALDLAEKFINKVNPDFPYEIRVINDDDANLYSTQYCFSIELYINGIRLDESYSSIAVNKQNGKVTRFVLSYIPIDYPSIENAISEDEAKQAYSEKLGLKTVYRTYTTEDNAYAAFPAYVQNYEGTYINALTGEEYTDKEDDTYMMTASSESAAAKAKDYYEFSEQEIEKITEIEGLLSKDEIVSKLKANKTLSIPAAASVKYIALEKNKYKNNSYAYVVTMYNDDDYMSAVADAKSGDISYYSRSGRITQGREYVRDDKVFKELAKDKAAEYVYDEASNRYQRYVNDVEVVGNIATIGYSGDTFALYSMSYTDTDFPSLDSAITKADAEKIMFDKDGYEMVYIINTSGDTASAVPVYKHNSVNINAFTGKYVNYENEEEIPNTVNIEYTDISGHYAEKYIKALAQCGIALDGKEFKPDEKLTKDDLYTLMYSIGSGKRTQAEDEDYSATVTRGEAAVYLIQAIGAEDYAKYEDIYTSPFADVTENKGYISLLKAMGIVSGDDVNFYPDREMTRAECAVMVCNYLTR